MENPEDTIRKYTNEGMVEKMHDENHTTSLRLLEMMFQAHARQLPLRGELKHP